MVSALSVRLVALKAIILTTPELDTALLVGQKRKILTIQIWKKLGRKSKKLLSNGSDRNTPKMMGHCQ